VYARENFWKECAQGGPPLLLMRSVISKYLEQHPNLNVEVPTQLVNDVKGGRIIYTPPYESWLQPIEMVWADVKAKVRRLSSRQRKGEELQQQTKMALREMDGERLLKKVLRVHKDIDAWLLSSDAGWLQAWKSFDLLWRSTANEREDEYRKFHGVITVEGAAEEAKTEAADENAAAVGGGRKSKRAKTQ